MLNFEILASINFYKNMNFVPRIGEQTYIEMAFQQSSYRAVERLPEQHFNVWLFFHPGDKIIIVVNILCSQDLRVQHIYVFRRPGWSQGLLYKERFDSLINKVPIFLNLYNQPKLWLTLVSLMGCVSIVLVELEGMGLLPINILV